jgi:flagellar biosynthesis protein FlhB
MAETFQEKTEPATPRRREEARKQGRIGRSTDLTAAVVVMGALVLLHVMGRSILGRLIGVTRQCLGDAEAAVDPGAAGATVLALFREFAAILLPLMLVVLVLAMLASFVQVGPLLTFKPMTPSLDKLNPVNGLKRMFSGRALMQLVMGLAKMSLLGAVAWWTISSRLDMLVAAPTLNHLAVVAVSAELIFTLGVRLGVLLLLLAIIDLVYQRWKTERDMRMTRQEIREELKRMDGDPLLKRRRREVQMQLHMQRIRSAIPKADVVVTNPTELAVVIRYDERTMNAPRVTAKGADHLARRIRELAIAHGVPIVERRPLAQALYRSVQVGQEIPAEFYRAVAEILAYVYELTGRSRQRSAAGMGLN